MKKTAIISTVIFGTLAVTTVMMPDFALAQFSKITPSTLKFEGIRYWRKKANEAKLGSVGQKMTPVAGKNYFQKVQDAPDGIYKVNVGSRTTLTTNEAKEWGITASHSNVSGSASGSGTYQGTITAYKMQIDLGNKKGGLRYETNRNHKHLKALKEEGDRGRLISAVWVLVEGDENKQECYSGDLAVSGGAWSVETTASGCSDSSWTIEPGSIIAYEMVKVDQWNNEELTERPSCPSGYSYESRSSPTTPMDRCVKTTYDTVAIECKLLVTDNKNNWYVKSRAGRDTCKSKKGKPDKGVKCSKSGYDYVAQAGRDNCRKPQQTYKDPTCPAGYDYDKKSTSNGGVDVCKLRGIASLKPDSQDGF